MKHTRSARSTPGRGLLNRPEPIPLRWAKNRVELAKILGVSRKTIQRYQEKPGAPKPASDGRWDVDAWRAFLSDSPALNDVCGDETIADLRKEQVRLQNEHIRQKIHEWNGTHADYATIEKWGGELGANIRKVVLQMHKCAPTVVGLSVAEAESHLKEIENDVLEQLHLLESHIDQMRPKVAKTEGDRENEPAA
jgi:phage terminase Nu1 subunit (DNA packaging protein)